MGLLGQQGRRQAESENTCHLSVTDGGLPFPAGGHGLSPPFSLSPALVDTDVSLREDADAFAPAPPLPPSASSASPSVAPSIICALVDLTRLAVSSVVVGAGAGR